MLNLLIPLLANAVPAIAGLFGKEDQAQSIVNTAKRVLGVSTDKELADRLPRLDANDIERLRIELEYHKLELQGLTKAAELNTQLKLADVSDKSSARAREVSLGSGNTGNKLMYGLAAFTMLINGTLLVLAFLSPDSLNNPGLMALVGAHTASMTLVLSYFFGSSVASK